MNLMQAPLTAPAVPARAAEPAADHPVCISVEGLSFSYGQKRAGEFVAVIDSEDMIEIALVNGNAAQRLGASIGDEVQVIFRGK